MSTMPSHRLDLERFRDADDPAIEAQVRLEASQIAMRRGDIQEARRLLRAVVRARPDHVDAWLRLAWITEDRQERQALLRRVLALQPGHPQARAEWSRLQRSGDGKRGADAGRTKAARTKAPRANAGRKSGPSHLWILASLTLAAALVLVAILIWGPVDDSLAWLLPTATPAPSPTPTLTPAQIAAQFLPQLETARAGGDWTRALEIVDIMRSVDPAGAEVQTWAYTTYMQGGQVRVQSGEVQAALPLFEEARGVAPDDQEARIWQQMTQAYLAGQASLERGEWDSAIQVFAGIQAQMPTYGDVSTRLVEAYRRQGQAAIDGEDWETAVESLLQAREMAPGDVEVGMLLSLAYRRQGQAAINGQDWDVAIENLAQGREQLPDDEALAGLLATAYRQRGISRYDKGQLKKARADLEAALSIIADDTEAQTYLDKVMYELYPPKRIEIDISKQWFYAWEGDELVYSFVTSTGLPGRDTATGHYKVLDKIPMAYSSIWRLQMPHWLGIYYVGNIENGIHALPIRPDGSVMWGGLLGQKASYGCVILSTKAAQIIYNWADVGTPVDIHY